MKRENLFVLICKKIAKWFRECFSLGEECLKGEKAVEGEEGAGGATVEGEEAAKIVAADGGEAHTVLVCHRGADWLDIKYHYFKVSSIRFFRLDGKQVCVYMEGNYVAKIDFSNESAAVSAYRRAKKLVAGWTDTSVKKA